ncbi:MAG: hypothetical protein PWR24_1123 [Desulfonauticus sp.]|nr:hypothetical protein [Desulfonauticus sp.]
MFQFLIGNVITSTVKMCKSGLSLFQFLIGNVITVANLLVEYCQNGFQFLIGNVITFTQSASPSNGIFVSIPHR